MWGVYPEARDWNVGALCLDFDFGERILRKTTGALKFGTLRKRAKLGALGAYFQDMITEIKI